MVLSRPSISSKGPVVKTLIQTAALALAATITTSTFANDGATQVHGVPSKTLAEAVANFSEYNQRLAKAVAEAPTPERLQEIHELTYTLQTALEKINEEMDGLTDTLEEIHISSEAQQADEVQEYAADYLKTARTVIK